MKKIILDSKKFNIIGGVSHSQCFWLPFKLLTGAVSGVDVAYGLACWYS